METGSGNAWKTQRETKRHRRDKRKAIEERNEKPWKREAEKYGKEKSNEKVWKRETEKYGKGKRKCIEKGNRNA
jgi:hypothetical protein